MVNLCYVKMKRARQTAFVFRTWGGKRAGSGGKPKGDTAGVSHLRRPALAARFPVHVTMRMHKHVWNLRTRRCFREIERAFWKGSARFGFRLLHYAVMGNHIHLLVEAEDSRTLARGMQGLSIRLARALNALMHRAGSVLADRYHARILRTPAEIKNVRNYPFGRTLNITMACSAPIPTFPTRQSHAPRRGSRASSVEKPGSGARCPSTSGHRGPC